MSIAAEKKTALANILRILRGPFDWNSYLDRNALAQALTTPSGHHISLREIEEASAKAWKASKPDRELVRILRTPLRQLSRRERNTLCAALTTRRGYCVTLRDIEDALAARRAA